MHEHEFELRTTSVRFGDVAEGAIFFNQLYNISQAFYGPGSVLAGLPKYEPALMTRPHAHPEEDCAAWTA